MISHGRLQDFWLMEGPQEGKSARENTHPYWISKQLKDQEFKGTIVVDSLTTILVPFIVQAIADKDMGQVKNLSAAFKPKAIMMRLLLDRVTQTGADTL